jgi:hypothetical protein
MMRAICGMPLYILRLNPFTHSISEQAIGKLRALVHLRLGQRSGTSGLLRGMLDTLPETGMLAA